MLELTLCFALLQAGDPHAAYENKTYDQALQGFLDLQVSHPDDPELMLNVGSTYYQLKDYPQAEKAFAQALANAGDNLALRQAAAYDLGNAAFNQGKLEEAAQRYRESLALNSNDVDARHNLQLAEAELQRRKQEAQKQPNQRDEKKPQDPSDPQQPGDQDKASDPKPQDGQPPPPKPDANKPGGADDPNKPPPGQGQQQPSKPGDKPDETQPGAAKPGDDKKPAGDKAAGADKRGKQGPVLSPEQAERYLQSVGETRPKKTLRGKAVQRMPNGKDW